jgi:hypothetical protein
MRVSINQYTKDGRLFNGFDYKNQAFAINGIYQPSTWGRVEAGTQPEPTDSVRLERLVSAGHAVYVEGN